MNIDTSLLREIFIIKEKQYSISNSNAMLIRCPSTRMPISLQSGGLQEEKIIVRTNNMHNCTRFVSKIIQNYEKHGPIARRLTKLDWDELWDKSLNSFERKYNHKRWVSVYHGGKSIYSDGGYHQFFDVIEQCDLINKGKYDISVSMAEKAFSSAGKEVNITYESNVALVAILNKTNGRCSMALRGPDKTNTFNYSLKPKAAGEELNVPQGLSTASDFLEGVQLCYLIGLNNEKLEQGVIEKFSDDYNKLRDARTRLTKLEIQINSMENRHQVRYRPERPNFELLITQTEEYIKNHIMNDSDDEVYID